MLRNFLPLSLTLGVLLMAPLASSAQDTPAPTPAVPAPIAPTPAPPKAHTHINGKITEVDAVKKTLTVSQHKKKTTVTVTDDTKIFKADDAKNAPTGAFGDLVVGTAVSIRTSGDTDSLKVVSIHIRAPKAAAPAVPATPTAPAAPATP